MRIGIVGTGNIGGTLARLLVRAGHEVVLANSRGPEAVAGLAAALGERATASTAAGAAEAGDVVIIAVPFARLGDLPTPSFAGKIVVDANNDWTGPRSDTGTKSSSEVVAAMLAGARLVKAFNTVEFVQLGEEGTPAGTPGRRAIAIAGDDQEAKATVARLVDDVGFDAYDVGPLAEGRRTMEPGRPLFGVRLTRDEMAASVA